MKSFLYAHQTRYFLIAVLLITGLGALSNCVPVPQISPSQNIPTVTISVKSKTPTSYPTVFFTTPNPTEWYTYLESRTVLKQPLNKFDNQSKGEISRNLVEAWLEKFLLEEADETQRLKSYEIDRIEFSEPEILQLATPNFSTPVYVTEGAYWCFYSFIKVKPFTSASTWKDYIFSQALEDGWFKQARQFEVYIDTTESVFRLIPLSFC